jgi:hypothetical protein
MNKKTVMIASGVVGLILASSACGSTTYSYDVSGLVEGQQVDYDCPGTDLSMDAVAFVSGKGGSGGTGGKKKSDSGSSDGDSGSGDSGKKKSDKKADTKKVDKAPAKGDQKANGSVAQPKTGTSANLTPSASTKPVKLRANKGVNLNDKPEKPEKLKSKKLPKVKYQFKPHGCKAEYEIFVWGKSGYLYEQDVRKVDYDKCLSAKVEKGLSAKRFPICTKG